MFSIVHDHEAFRPEIEAYVKDNWGGPMVVTLGSLFDTRDLPRFVAIENDALAGALIYQIHGDACEVAALFATRRGKGVGRALLDTLVTYARERGCRTVWLVTTNDNTAAMRFYQKYGFTLRAAHIGAFALTRELKGLDVEFGEDGIRIEHEMEFVYHL